MYKKINIIVIIYIISLLILVFFGFMGDHNKETIDYASRYFSKQFIDTGKSYFLSGLITAMFYSIIAILFLLLIIHKGYWKRFSEWLSIKIKYNYLCTFISFIIIFLSLNIIRLPFALF